MIVDDKRLSYFTLPFSESDIEWRIQQSGTSNKGPWARILAYVTNRAIMGRLDKVVGPSAWKNEFKPLGDKSMLCGISIKIDGEWITKWDGADNTNIEATKGGISGAMKRAAVQWGMGRYLYQLTETWAIFSDQGQYNHYDKQKKQSFRWSPPKLPEWALPKTEKK